MIDMDDIPMSTGPLNEVRPGLYLGSNEAETMPLTRLQNYGISHIVQARTKAPMKSDKITSDVLQPHQGIQMLVPQRAGPVNSAPCLDMH